MIFTKLSPSNDKKYKYTMTFMNNDGQTKKVSFGAKGYSDYTIHKNPERKERYLKRHFKNENWNNPFSRGSLSAFILWNKPTIKESFDFYNDYFGFKKLN